MTELKDESLHNLACLLISAASDLNGTSRAGSIMDGGRWSTQQIQEIMGEIVTRCKADPAIQEHAALKPVIDAIRDLKDLENSRDIAMALKEIPHTEYVPVEKPGPTNPFARKM